MLMVLKIMKTVINIMVMMMMNMIISDYGND